MSRSFFEILFGLPGFTIFLMSTGVIFATGRDHRSRLQRFRIVIPQSFTASRRPLAADVDGPGYKAEAAPLARRRLD
jgi:hypothetical protein